MSKTITNLYILKCKKKSIIQMLLIGITTASLWSCHKQDAGMKHVTPYIEGYKRMDSSKESNQALALSSIGADQLQIELKTEQELLSATQALTDFLNVNRPQTGVNTKKIAQQLAVGCLGVGTVCWLTSTMSGMIENSYNKPNPCFNYGSNIENDNDINRLGRECGSYPNVIINQNIEHVKNYMQKMLWSMVHEQHANTTITDFKEYAAGFINSMINRDNCDATIADLKGYALALAHNIVGITDHVGLMMHSEAGFANSCVQVYGPYINNLINRLQTCYSEQLSDVSLTWLIPYISSTFGGLFLISGNCLGYYGWKGIPEEEEWKTKNKKMRNLQNELANRYSYLVPKQKKRLNQGYEEKVIKARSDLPRFFRKLSKLVELTHNTMQPGSRERLELEGIVERLSNLAQGSQLESIRSSSEHHQHVLNRCIEQIELIRQQICPQAQSSATSPV